jgi:hypothetical protein
MSQPATKFATESPAFREAVRDQIEMTRRAVSAGEDKELQDAVHPDLWEHLGPVRTLRRREGLCEVI